MHAFAAKTTVQIRLAVLTVVVAQDGTDAGLGESQQLGWATKPLR